MKQQVINYQFEILRNHLIRSDKYNQSNQYDVFRYSPWKLDATLNKIKHSNHKQLKWIGNSQTSYIIGYFYCLFKMCAGKQQILIRLKHSLYKICQYCLNISQQKYLVQFIGLLSQSQPLISTYLQKNSYIQDLLVKIYQSSIQLVKFDRQKINQNDKIDIDQIDTFIRLKSYSQVLFSFLSVQYVQSSQNALQIKLMGKQQKIFLIRQKECYFILQDNPKIRNKQKKILSLEHRSPGLQQCVIIDQQIDEEETYNRDNSGKQSRNSTKKSPSKSKSGLNAQSPSPSKQKKKQNRVPKFLCNPKRQSKQSRTSLNNIVQANIENKRPNYPKKKNYPIKQNYVTNKNKIFYVKEVSKPLVPSNSIMKSTNKSLSKSLSKSYSKNSRQQHSQKHNKIPLKLSHKQPIKQKNKYRYNINTNKVIPVSGIINSINSINPSGRYNNHESDEKIKIRKQQQQTSLEKLKKSSLKNKISVNFANVKYVQQTQRNISPNFQFNNGNPIHKTHKITKSGFQGRLSQSHIPYSFNLDFHAPR